MELRESRIRLFHTTISDLSPGGSTGSYTCDSNGRTAPSLSNKVTFGDTNIAFYINGDADSPTTQNTMDLIQLTTTTPAGGGLEQ